MATIYLRSTDGSDSDDGSTWALAKATLAAALTAAGAGGTVYVSDNHAETQGSAMTLTSPGTAASPTNVICVDDAAEPPTTRAMTATVTTTGSFNITINGFAYCYGVTFNNGTGAGSQVLFLGSGTPFYWCFENCNLNVPSTGNASAVSIAQSNPSATDDHIIELINTSMKFANVGARIYFYANLLWYGGRVDPAGSIPTTLFQPGGVPGVKADLNGVDLSALGSGKNIILGTAGRPVFLNMTNCKLGASVTFVNGTISGPGALEFRAVNCDSGDTNYKYYKQTWHGVVRDETTNVRTGGASDKTTPLGWAMISSADTKFYLPLMTDWITVWNEDLAEITVAVETLTDGVTLTDAECWVQVEYPGSSSAPLSLRTSDRVTDPIFGTPASQTSSSVGWNVTGLASPVKQKLSIAFTPQEKGLIRARVCLAKPSTTVYVDPLIMPRNSRQFQADMNYVNEYGGMLRHPGMTGGMRG